MNERTFRQFENQSPALVEAGLKLTRSYDELFYGNASDARKTITMSDRDVIYVTRAMIPFLSKYGVQGLTIGSNGANYPPQVPKLHVWKDDVSGTDVIVVYHPCVRACVRAGGRAGVCVLVYLLCPTNQ